MGAGYNSLSPENVYGQPPPRWRAPASTGLNPSAANLLSPENVYGQPPAAPSGGLNPDPYGNPNSFDLPAFNTAHGISNPATDTKVAPNLNGGGNAYWNGTNWSGTPTKTPDASAVTGIHMSPTQGDGFNGPHNADGSVQTFSNAADAAAHGANVAYGINVPMPGPSPSPSQPAAPAPAGLGLKALPSDFPRQSSASTVANPYGTYNPATNSFDSPYANALIGQQRGAVDQQYNQQMDQLRADAASRGLQVNEADLRALEMGRAHDMGGLEGGAIINAADKGSQFGLQQAGQEDAYRMNVGNLDLGFSADARANQYQGTMLPIQAQAGQIANTTAQGLQPSQIDAAKAVAAGDWLGNQAEQQKINQGAALFPGVLTGQDLQNLNAGIQNQTSQQHLDAFKQQWPVELQQLQNQGKLTAAQAQQAQWVADNQGWMAALSFIGNLAGAGAKVAGAVAGMGA